MGVVKKSSLWNKYGDPKIPNPNLNPKPEILNPTLNPELKILNPILNPKPQPYILLKNPNPKKQRALHALGAYAACRFQSAHDED